MAFRSITPSININTESGQLRTELLNTFVRLDGQLALAPYRLGTTVGPISNTAGLGQIISTLTVPYNTLTKNGQSILFSVCGTTSANANNKNIQLYFGNTLLFETTDQAFNDVDWIITGELIRSSDLSQTVHVQFFASATLTQKITVGFASEDFGVNNDFEVRGLGTDGDIQLYYAKYTLLA